MKQIRNVEKSHLNMVINEAALVSYLNSNCNELIRCEDLYYSDKDKAVFIILEYMDQGSMQKICSEGYQSYSEQFCKYSLFKVLLGLKKMHDNNVLHRDIKSDNVIYSLQGDVKITDLGFACCLSEQ